MLRKLVACAALAAAGLMTSSAEAGGGRLPNVMYYPYYYPPYAYSSHGPFYSHVYPYYATYYYPHYAPYYPVYPTVYVGPGPAVQVFTPTAGEFVLPDPRSVR